MYIDNNPQNYNIETVTNLISEGYKVRSISTGNYKNRFSVLLQLSKYWGSIYKLCYLNDFYLHQVNNMPKSSYFS